MSSFLNYFAYGSLMDIEFVKDLGVNFKNPRKGILTDFKFAVNVEDDLIPENGYANVIPFEAGIVEGVLMEINPEDLSLLDVYEGYPSLYSRRKLTIYDNKKLIDAWVYIGTVDSSVNKSLKLTNIQIERITNGFKFLSVPYQTQLVKKIVG